MSWVIVGLTLLRLVHAQQNVISVDDNDPSIVYTGSWDPDSEHPSGLDFGGSHTLSADTTATATFTFTGVAVEYLAPKWPYLVNSYVSLDGATPVLVDMTALGTPNVDGHETVQSAPLWSAENLENTVHHVVVTTGTSGYAVVDGFKYTQATVTSTNQPTTSTLTLTGSAHNSSSSSYTVPSESNNSTTTTSSNQSLIITISVSVGVVAILVIAIILLIANRRRKARQGRLEANDTYNIPATGPMAAFSDVQAYHSVPVNDTLHPYQPPAQDPQRYSSNPYSGYSPDMSQSDSLRYSGYGQGPAGNTVPTWGQYGLYPAGIPQPPSPAAPSDSLPSSASPNSQTRFIVPTNYNQPETPSNNLYEVPPPGSPPPPPTTLMRSPSGLPAYASQYGSPSEPVPSMPPEFQSPSTSRPPAQVNAITNFADPPKRRYEGKKGKSRI